MYMYAGTSHDEFLHPHRACSYNGQVDMTFQQLVYDVSSTKGAPPTAISNPGSQFARKTVCYTTIVR